MMERNQTTCSMKHGCMRARETNFNTTTHTGDECAALLYMILHVTLYAIDQMARFSLAIGGRARAGQRHHITNRTHEAHCHVYVPSPIEYRTLGLQSLSSALSSSQPIARLLALLLSTPCPGHHLMGLNSPVPGSSSPILLRVSCHPSLIHRACSIFSPISSPQRGMSQGSKNPFVLPRCSYRK